MRSIEQEEKETKVKYILVWVGLKGMLSEKRLKEELINKNYFNDNYRTIISGRLLFQFEIRIKKKLFNIPHSFPSTYVTSHSIIFTTINTTTFLFVVGVDGSI
jgi:hypothetical protein